MVNKDKQSIFRRPSEKEAGRTIRVITTLALPAGIYVLWATYPSLPSEQVVFGVLVLALLSLVVIRSWFQRSEDNDKKE